MRFRLGVYKAIASIVARGRERTNQRGTAGNRRPKSPLREGLGGRAAIKQRRWLKTKGKHDDRIEEKGTWRERETRDY